MQTTPQSSHKVKITTKRELTVRKVLNIYGVFTILALLTSIFTVPISLSENLQLHYNHELLMSAKKLTEFLSFIFVSSLVYFFLVNFKFKRTE